jgi:hypothetical protein
MSQEEQEKQEKAFTVTDRRFSKEGKEERVEAPAAQEATGPMEAPAVEADFSGFVFSLGNSVLLSLGAIPDPSGKTDYVNLEGAKHMIDILGVLQEKTRGNLTPEEDHLLVSLLSDLRLCYVEKTKAQGPHPGP